LLEKLNKILNLSIEKMDMENNMSYNALLAQIAKDVATTISLLKSEKNVTKAGPAKDTKIVIGEKETIKSNTPGV
jgi:hypothetical protein